jgi:hypothetical protein
MRLHSTAMTVAANRLSAAVTARVAATQAAVVQAAKMRQRTCKRDGAAAAGPRLMVCLLPPLQQVVHRVVR